MMQSLNNLDNSDNGELLTEYPHSPKEVRELIKNGELTWKKLPKPERVKLVDYIYLEGLTKYEIAEEFGVRTNLISRYLNDVKKIRVDEILMDTITLVVGGFILEAERTKRGLEKILRKYERTGKLGPTSEANIKFKIFTVEKELLKRMADLGLRTRTPDDHKEFIATTSVDKVRTEIENLEMRMSKVTGEEKEELEGLLTEARKCLDLIDDDRRPQSNNNEVLDVEYSEEINTP